MTDVDNIAWENTNHSINLLMKEEGKDTQITLPLRRFGFVFSLGNEAAAAFLHLSVELICDDVREGSGQMSYDDGTVACDSATCLG